jgi:hypothetical protein
MSMEMTPMRRAMTRPGSRGPVAWLLTILVLGAALIQACSDNTGPAGTTFPTGVTGTATEGLFTVNITLNPNSVQINQRIGITVLVQSVSGIGIQGEHVQVGTTAGRLDIVDGFTDADGKFVTFLLCDGAFVAQITAVVRGTLTAAPSGAQCGIVESSSSSSSSAGP